MLGPACLHKHAVGSVLLLTTPVRHILCFSSLSRIMHLKFKGSSRN
uniref:Uncharacterized protein n=2 Tax=Lepeophtheirus salmonis TaxID=72036 RepID=A0A0K2T0S2_LEPSM